MKKAIIILLVFIGGISLYIQSEYRWSEKIISKKIGNSDIVYEGYDDNLLKPWTWIKQPINKIMIVRKAEYGKMNDQYYFAHAITFRKDGNDEEDIFIIDAVNSRNASCNSLEEFQKLTEADLNNLTWFKYDKDSPSGRVAEFLKKNVKTYLSMDPLGNERDITNYICSGQYDIKDKTPKYVHSLVNHHPYTVTFEDKSIIEIELHNWLQKNSQYSNVSEKIPFSKIKYVYSEMLYTMTDIFSFDVTAVEKGEDTNINIEFTLSKLYQPDNTNANKAIFFP